MHKRFIIYFLIFGSLIARAQKPLQLTLNYTGDLVSNYSGGDRRAVQWMGLVDAGIAWDTQAAKWWKGGLFNFEMIHTHGKGISTTTLHDLQGLSSIEAGNHALLFWTLWYHQQFGKLGIRAGLQNINSDFMNQPFSADFTCSSYGLFPTLSLNYSLPNYPTAGLGISVSYRINPRWGFLTSLFNGKVTDINKDRFNIRWRLNPKDDGLLSVSELKYSSDSTRRLASVYGLGVAFHNKPFTAVREKYENEAELQTYKNNYTLYLFGEHDFYRTSTQNAGVFLQASYAPKNRNLAYAYSGIGFVMNGFLTRSHIDRAGIGLSQLYYQDTDANRLKKGVESTIEVYALFQLHKYLSVKPSFFSILSSGKTTITGGLVEFGLTLF